MVLNTKVYGEGFPLIIIHGLLGSLDNWQSIAKYLGQKYQVITLDMRNHGRSEHEEVFTYDAMVQDVVDTMQYMSISKASFIGHSMGGKIVMYMALYHPEMVEKLIVADIAPINYAAHHDDVFNALNAVPIESIENRSDAENIIAQHVKENDVVQFLMKGLYRKEDNTFGWRFNISIIEKSYANILSFDINNEVFEGETLFIRGELSKYIQNKDWEHIHELYPRAKLETIVGAGHWLHADNPAEFYQTVSKFINH